MKHDDALIEAWLDGRLTVEQTIEFEERIESDPAFRERTRVAGGVDDGLARRFGTAQAADGAAARALAGALRATGLDARREPVASAPRALPSSDLESWGPPLFALVAAAIIVVVAHLGIGRERTPLVAPHEAPVASSTTDGVRVAALGPEALVGPTVGPLETLALERPLERMTRPNLESIYDDARYWTVDRNLNACGDRDDLGGALLASYGQKLEVAPGAADLFQGPFASDQWPTGTILAAHTGDETAVLIAEREFVHRCCLDVDLPDESDLNVFTWQLGDIVLTEITPASEPRLLGYFSEVR